MASVFKMKDGKFRASICVKGVRRTKVCRTKAAAEEWAAHAETQETGRSPRIDKTGAELLLSMIPHQILDAINEIPYSHSEVVRNALPFGVATGVYFLIKDARVIYVGKSVNVLDRIGKHRREGKWFDSFNYLPCPAGRLDEIEARYILAFMPKMNASLTIKRAKTSTSLSTSTTLTS